MLSLIRRWILPSTPASPSAFSFFSPHYVPAISAIASTRPFSTYPPLHSDNKPSNPGTKASNPKPHAPPPSSPTDVPSTTSRSIPSQTDDGTFKPVVTPAWNELMTILSKHVYDSAWSPEAQARYTQIIKQYPYISPETQYATGMPTPPGMSPREACQSAAEEAFFADYRPLRAGFAEDYTESATEGEDEIVVDLGSGMVQVGMTRDRLVDLVKSVAGKDIELLQFTPLATAFAVSRAKLHENIRELTSTRRKRYTKMKNHKRRGENKEQK